MALFSVVQASGLYASLRLRPIPRIPLTPLPVNSPVLLPHAHSVLWFLAAFLGLWALSILIRALTHRSRTGTPTCPACRAAITTPALVCPACAYHAAARREFWPRTPHAPAILVALALLATAVLVFLAGNAEAKLVSVSPFVGGVRALSVGLALGLFTILARVYIGDSPKGRRRCPACWYDMASLADKDHLTCPECGHAAKTHADLLRRRRRPRLALALLPLVLLALWIPNLLAARTKGPLALIPTPVLILGMWHLPESWILEPQTRNPLLPTPLYSLAARLANHRETPAWCREWTFHRARTQLNAAYEPEKFSRAVQLSLYNYDSDLTASAAIIKTCIDHADSNDPRFLSIVRTYLGRAIATASFTKDPEPVLAVIRPRTEALRRILETSPNASSYASLLQLMGPDTATFVPVVANAIKNPTLIDQRQAAWVLVSAARTSQEARQEALKIVRGDNPNAIAWLGLAAYADLDSELFDAAAQALDTDDPTLFTARAVFILRYANRREKALSTLRDRARGSNALPALKAITFLVADRTVLHHDIVGEIAPLVRAIPPANRADAVFELSTLVRSLGPQEHLLAIIRELAADADPKIAKPAESLLNEIAAPVQERGATLSPIR